MKVNTQSPIPTFVDTTLALKDLAGIGLGLSLFICTLSGCNGNISWVGMSMCEM